MLKFYTPFLSVIIPTYNRETFLKIALESVLNQTVKDFELLIVDDGSTDNTSDLIKSYHDKRIKYLYQPNNGVASARNLGLKFSKGEFIAFLDSDDRWDPKKLEITLNYIHRFPNIYIFHTEEIWYRRGTLLNQKKRHKKPSGHVYSNALPLCCIGMSTAVVKREVFEKIGRFDETLPACEDYDFLLRATHEFEVKLIEEPLTIKDGGRPDQLSSRWGLDRYRINALEKMLASNSLSDEEFCLTCQELFKKCRIYADGTIKRGRVEEANYYIDLIEKYRIHFHINQ